MVSVQLERLGYAELFSCGILDVAMKIKREPTRLEKKARRGQRGYPVATVAFYGPDASRASKVVVGIIRSEGGGAEEMKKWFSDTADLRRDPAPTKRFLRSSRSMGRRRLP
jgi:hypothetical protein